MNYPASSATTPPLISIECENLFPAKSDRKLPFIVVKAGEKNGLRLSVRLRLPPGHSPKSLRRGLSWHFTDEEGKQINQQIHLQIGKPEIKAPEEDARTPGEVVYTFACSLSSDHTNAIYRVRFQHPSDQTAVANSSPFIVPKNTGHDRPEMRRGLCSLLQLVAVKQGQHSIEQAIKLIDEALEIWLGIKHIRHRADLNWLVHRLVEAEQLRSTNVHQRWTDTNVFNKLFTWMKDNLPQIGGSQLLMRLYHFTDPPLLLPAFYPTSQLKELLVASGDFTFRLSQSKPNRFLLSWLDDDSEISHCPFEFKPTTARGNASARGRELLWEVSHDEEQGRRLTHIKSLSVLLQQFPLARRFIVLDGEESKGLEKQQVLDLLERLLPANVEEEEEDEEARESFSITASVSLANRVLI